MPGRIYKKQVYIDIHSFKIMDFYSEARMSKTIQCAFKFS